MSSRTSLNLRSLAARIPRAAVFGARLYLALAVIQFVVGFVVGGALVLLDYDVEAVRAMLAEYQ